MIASLTGWAQEPCYGGATRRDPRNSNCASADHFEPQDIDPQEQRRLRGLLEQIDYAAYVSNREVVGTVLAGVTPATFQKLAVTTAGARARWAAEAVRLAESGSPATADQVARLSSARAAYEELAEAYEALRRMVERGYLRVG